MVDPFRRVTPLHASASDPETVLGQDWLEYFRNQLATPRVRLEPLLNNLRQDMAGAMRRLVPPSASVLEVGVGSGRLLASLPNEQRHGLDILPEALERTRAADPRIHLHRGDAMSCNLGRTFDALICDRLAHSVPDVLTLLNNLCAHLADRGRIFLTVFNYAWALPSAAVSALRLHVPPPPQNWLTENDLDNIFGIAGLQVVGLEDRLMLPVNVPVVAPLANRVLAHVTPLNHLSMYRVYTLRRQRVRRRDASVTVVVPARNEAGNIRDAIHRTPVMGHSTELIFVEGGSTDDTAATIRREVAAYRGPLKLRVLQQPGRGKKDAVLAGFAHARGDMLMILDADLTVPPESLPRFHDLLVDGVADYVQGTRLVYPMEDDAMRLLNRAGNSMFARAFSTLLGQPITDTLCGTKVMWREDWEGGAQHRASMGDLDPFGDFDLLFSARQMNLRIMEVPVRYRARTYGSTNIDRFRHGALLLRMCAVGARRIKFV